MGGNRVMVRINELILSLWKDMQIFSVVLHALTSGADPGGGGGAGAGAHPGKEGPAPKARVPSSQGQKDGTLVSFEWLFNTIQA